MPPKNIYEDKTVFSPPTPAQATVPVIPAAQPQMPVIPPHKKGFPKIFIFIGVVVVLLVLAFLVIKLLASSKGAT